MSTTAAATLINWSDLWKIVVAALVGGSGVVLVFGLLLLGISRGQSSTRRTARFGLYALSALCGAFVVAVANSSNVFVYKLSEGGGMSPSTASSTAWSCTSTSG